MTTDRKSEGQISVVLVDDHEPMRAGLRSLLSSDETITVVGEANTESEAVSMISELQPDVATLDIRLRQGTGVGASRTLRALSLPTKVLILTAYDDGPYIAASLNAGVAGYLLKTVSQGELTRAIHDASAGTFVCAREVATKVASMIRGGLVCLNSAARFDKWNHAAVR